MIDQIAIRNFKCFREEQFELGKLNIFCGANGVGKSSLIQAFLIAREVFQWADTPAYVKLNNLFKQDLGQILFRGNKIVCEFHTKLKPTHDRIHFSPSVRSETDESKYIVVGPFAEHLTT